ncbi:MAG: transketolase [Candidatus Edwardsbacteria bacterium]|nr:transketolase [Candidatus Edwardsbacteria bacterium]MBU1576530.1 transketolase [Candidatus Edwardsbacteria bacterium]MBU2464377.1 transketolase [Candidatus Edwardsbacteria bacterium]MBU2593691.1 transketolase [Candidatus Edwardsbacteria bacterium]
MTLAQLKKIARQIRRDIIEMTYKAGSGHPGGSLSSADIMAVLYFDIMKHDPKNPKWEQRDRFFLSKGHACPVLYAALAESGYFPKKHLATFRHLGSLLQGHPHSLKTPGIEMSSGSLGQGLSIAAGTALGLKMDGNKARVFCLMGDGELQEGQIWEAAMAAGHFKLNNLIGIVDYNNLQIDGPVEKVMGLAPLADKWRAFRWNVIEVNGHDIARIKKAFIKAGQSKIKPTVIIARTVKGKGVSFMENQAGWHGRAPNREEYAKAMKELNSLTF